MPHISVRSADTPPTSEDFRQILIEYFAHLELTWPTPNPERWRREVDGLPGAFACPSGRMLVAYVGDAPAGVVALLGQDAGACEVKRLYVRPKFRRLGVSRALMHTVLAEAAETGYAVMRLGTSPEFTEAIALYESLGFERAEQFRDGFAEHLVFMARRLGEDA